jgi:hypothetical protein
VWKTIRTFQYPSRVRHQPCQIISDPTFSSETPALLFVHHVLRRREIALERAWSLKQNTKAIPNKIHKWEVAPGTYSDLNGSLFDEFTLLIFWREAVKATKNQAAQLSWHVLAQVLPRL